MIVIKCTDKTKLVTASLILDNISIWLQKLVTFYLNTATAVTLAAY